jgi:hypothetical protein
LKATCAQIRILFFVKVNILGFIFLIVVVAGKLMQLMQLIQQWIAELLHQLQKTPYTQQQPAGCAAICVLASALGMGCRLVVQAATNGTKGMMEPTRPLTEYLPLPYLKQNMLRKRQDYFSVGRNTFLKTHKAW